MIIYICPRGVKLYEHETKEAGLKASLYGHHLLLVPTVSKLAAGAVAGSDTAIAAAAIT